MKNNKGFTLIEIIISIAVLSIISAIFLELFIKADVVQKQGKITDDKAFLISNLFETLIAQDTIASFADQTLPQSKQEKRENTVLTIFMINLSIKWKKPIPTTICKSHLRKKSG